MDAEEQAIKTNCELHTKRSNANSPEASPLKEELPDAPTPAVKEGVKLARMRPTELLLCKDKELAHKEKKER